MDAIYIISLVVGGVLLLASLLGDVIHTDAFDGDVHPGDLHILTIRGATYFLFVFGTIGVVLPRMANAGPILTAILATGAGFATSSIAGRVFSYLRTTDSGEIDADRSLHGLTAQVVIPIRANDVGKVSVRRGTERLELLARAFDEADGDPASWQHVRIIDVREGTALVSPAQPET